MEKVKAKLAVWKQDRWLVRAAIAGGSALLLLFVCLCVTTYMRSNIQHRYANAANGIQEQTYQELIDMTELYDRVDEPGVDVQHKLIPQLQAEYACAAALNTALTDYFGSDKAVLSAEQTAALDAAFDEYSAAYSQGLATGLAHNDMSACMEDVQQMIDDRYVPKAEPTEPVVIIDGSSGEIISGES